MMNIYDWGDVQRRLSEEMTKSARRYQKGLEVLSNPPQVEVGGSPHEVIYTDNKMRLLHYLPTQKTLFPVPVLIVYALINRPYIMDLEPGRSLIEYLVNQGLDVYLIDWGVPGNEDKGLRIEDYINGYIPRCEERVLEASGAQRLSLLGYCMGGTLAVMSAALHQKNLKNLALIASPIDFKKNGLLSLWTDERWFDVDKLIDTFGNVPPEFLQSIFLLLKPVQNLLTKYLHFYESLANGDSSARHFFAMEKWVTDNIPFPGEAFRQFVKDCWQKNLLVQNKMRLGGKTIDLRTITLPLLNVMAEKDHLVEPSSSKPLNALVGSEDQEIVVLPGGHVGMMAGGKAKELLYPTVSRWLVARSS